MIVGRKHHDSRNQHLKDSVLGAIFLGVPHNGCEVTIVGKLVSLTTYWLGASTEILEVLGAGWEPLRTLNELLRLRAVPHGEAPNYKLVPAKIQTIARKVEQVLAGMFGVCF